MKPRQERKTDRQDGIVNALRDRIVSGEWAPGARVPNRVDIEKSYGASSITVQRALERLKQEGFVVASRRSGTYVAPAPPHLHQYALIFPSLPDTPEWNRFWTALLQEAQFLSQHGSRRLSVFYRIDAHADSPDYHVLVRAVQERRLAGLVFANTPEPLRHTPLLQDYPLPASAISYKTSIKGLPLVSPNGNSFRDRAIGELKAAGCRRIAVLTTVGTPEEYRSAIEEQGLITRPYWLQQISLWHPDTVRGVVHLLMNANQRERPDGLIIANDNLVEGASRGLLDAGIDVPGKIRVVSHCNFPWPATSLVPVTRIGFDARQILRTCLDLVDAQRRSEPVPPNTAIDAIHEDELPGATLAV